MSASPDQNTFTFTDPEGVEVFVYRWGPPAGKAMRAIVQIAHGAAEHALRYARFAQFLNRAGFCVYANDHRGHWKTAGDLPRAGIAGPDGWNGMLKDMHLLTERIKQENPGLPIFLFGHSMGSFLSQRYIQLWGSELKGVILSATSGLPVIDPAFIPMLEQVAAAAPDAPSQAFMALFASVNEPFKPVRTAFDWLSRDEVEVQKYVDDPWCGFPFTNLLTLDFARGAVDFIEPKNEALIPKNLPVLLVSGALDPVGASGAGVQALFNRYQGYGIGDITCKLYPGARHEILNETNRAEVQQDILDWLNVHLD